MKTTRIFTLSTVLVWLFCLCPSHVQGGHIDPSKRAECVREAVDRISPSGKIFAMGFGTETKYGEVLGFESSWPKEKKGDGNIDSSSHQESFKGSKEEADPQVEVTEVIVKEVDLKTKNGSKHKIPNNKSKKNSRQQTAKKLLQDVQDKSHQAQVPDSKCRVWGIAPHISVGSQDGSTENTCNYSKEIYRLKTCKEQDVNGNCLKESFSYGESAPRYECVVPVDKHEEETDLTTFNQCIKWQIDPNNPDSLTCVESSLFSSSKICLTPSRNPHHPCKTPATLYPKFICQSTIHIGGKAYCGEVNPVYPLVYCRSFVLSSGHRYCQRYGYYYPRVGSDVVCTHSFEGKGCELRCARYGVKGRDSGLYGFGGIIEIQGKEKEGGSEGEKGQNYDIFDRETIVKRINSKMNELLSGSPSSSAPSCQLHKVKALQKKLTSTLHRIYSAEFTLLHSLQTLTPTLLYHKSHCTSATCHQSIRSALNQYAQRAQSINRWIEGTWNAIALISKVNRRDRDGCYSLDRVVKEVDRVMEGVEVKRYIDGIMEEYRGIEELKKRMKSEYRDISGKKDSKFTQEENPFMIHELDTFLTKFQEKKQAAYNIFEAYHEYFLRMKNQGQAKAYYARFISWRSLSIKYKKLEKHYSKLASACPSRSLPSPNRLSTPLKSTHSSTPTPSPTKCLLFPILSTLYHSKASTLSTLLTHTPSPTLSSHSSRRLHVIIQSAMPIMKNITGNNKYYRSKLCTKHSGNSVQRELDFQLVKSIKDNLYSFSKADREILQSCFA